MVTMGSWHGDDLERAVNELEYLVPSLGADHWCTDSGAIDWSHAGHRDWDQTRTVDVYVTDGGAAERVKNELLAAGAELATESRAAASLTGPYLEVSIECPPPLLAVCRQAAYELLRDAADDARLTRQPPNQQAVTLTELLGAWYASGPVGDHATDAWTADPGLLEVASTLIADEVAQRRRVSLSWRPESRLACRTVGEVAVEYGLQHLAAWRSLSGSEQGAQPTEDGRRVTLWGSPDAPARERGTCPESLDPF